MRSVLETILHGHGAKKARKDHNAQKKKADNAERKRNKKKK
jgi:hypothetical protein